MIRQPTSHARRLLPALSLLTLVAAAALVPASRSSATPNPKRGTPRAQQQCAPAPETLVDPVGAPPGDDEDEGWFRIDVVGPSWTY